MLISLDTGKPIKRMPFAKEFAALRKALTVAEFNAAVGRINELIDASNDGKGDIATAGWLPGRSWRDTPFWPIYTKFKQDETVAAKMFGLLVWYVFMERTERWGSGRYQKDGRDIGSRTYFRLRDP